MTEMNLYPGDALLARRVFKPASLIVVTGPMGSGVTDFSLRLLESFKGEVFLTEYLIDAPKQFHQEWMLSGFLRAIAANQGTPTAIFVDHFGPGVYPRRRTMTNAQYAGLGLAKACQKAKAVLIVAGHGLHVMEDFPVGFLSGWNQIILFEKLDRSHAVLWRRNVKGRWMKLIAFKGVPRTNLRFNTQEMSMFSVDVNPYKFALFFADLVRTPTSGE